MFKKIAAVFDKLPGEWLVFISAFLFSTAGGVTKSFQMDAILLPGVRSLLAGLVLLPFLRPKQIVWDRWLACLIASFTGLVLFILCAIRFTTASNALALQFTTPLFICLGNWLFLHKRPSARRLLPIVIMLIGIIIILCEPNTGTNFLGNLCGVGAGLAFAGVSVSLNRVRAGGYLSTITLLNLMAGVIILVPLLLWPTYHVHIELSAIPYVLFLGLVQLSGGYIFYMMGVRKVGPQKASILDVWEFILTPVWAFLMVRELPTVYGAVGWVVLLIAVLIENRFVGEGE
ncbi:MAG: EamA family transporter [Firmicutes bacterium]|nr:EamA family transporter [Bacillota bacterium]